MRLFTEQPLLAHDPKLQDAGDPIDDELTWRYVPRETVDRLLLID